VRLNWGLLRSLCNYRHYELKRGFEEWSEVIPKCLGGTLNQGIASVVRDNGESHQGNSVSICLPRQAMTRVYIVYQFLISSNKSFHLGLIELINRSFIFLDPALICFSLAMASSIE
jgi:hypothetical protein